MCEKEEYFRSVEIEYRDALAAKAAKTARQALDELATMIAPHLRDLWEPALCRRAFEIIREAADDASAPSNVRKAARRWIAESGM